MPRTIAILGISGSGSKRSFNQGLLDAAKEMLPADAELEMIDVSKFPLFSKDSERDPPPEVRAFKQKVRDSDAILFAAPEHNYSISAVLKNAIEWGNRPLEDNCWDGKPAAIISASTSLRGGARAQLHLRQIMVDLNMHPINEPQLMVARAQDAFDSNLRLKDEKARETLKAVVEALVAWAAKLGGQ
ncbi:MAG: NAD(P)H-dependent oxidoreductase [Nitrososphaerales archaeon]|nr:NAD(P)H-dependent oxidoreductase [Nitrososphaerales archaeon]